MNPINLFNKFFGQIKDRFQNETELVRLKLIRALSSIAAQLFAAVFIIIMLNITLAILGIWFGFFLSGLLDSFAIGFGLAALSYLLILGLIIIFRHPLLIRPFTDISIAIMTELKFDEENEEAEES